MDDDTIADIDRRIGNLQASLAPVVAINADCRIRGLRDCNSEDEVDSCLRERSLRKRISALQKRQHLYGLRRMSDVG